MDNVNALITSWGLEQFDYVLMHFDNSSSEWNKCVYDWSSIGCGDAILNFDETHLAWENRFQWYKHTVGITAQQQAKLWFYKRFAAPWLVKVLNKGMAFPERCYFFPFKVRRRFQLQGYRYVHFVDSDAGSPREHPFNLETYENILEKHMILIAQPAVARGGRYGLEDVLKTITSDL